MYSVDDTTNEVVGIDTGSLQITNRATLPGEPSAAAIASDGTLYVAGGDAGQLWIVDPTTLQVANSVLVGSKPSAVAVSRDGSRVYVADRGDGSLAVIGVPGYQISARIPVGKDPVALVLAPVRPAAGRPPPDNS
jgi:YVTN family beta-propeller protein